MSDKSDSSDSKIKVTDRRRFTQDAEDEARAHEDANPSQASGDATSKVEESAPAGASEGAAGKSPKGVRELPPIDFGTFVLSLASSALVHLGEVEDPESGEKKRNLPLARQTIDLLGMLQEKTKGNLTRDEAHYLESILYDLRMRCVAPRS